MIFLLIDYYLIQLTKEETFVIIYTTYFGELSSSGTTNW